MEGEGDAGEVSALDPEVLMEEILEYLKLLNYESDF